MRDPHAITLTTFVLQPHHVIIVEDWLDFFDQGVRDLVVHVGADPEIEPRLKALCDSRKVGLRILGSVSVCDTTDNELDLLYEQFAVVKDGLVCMVRLDTLPYRRPDLRWQADAIDRMIAAGAPFLTGATKPFRADQATAVSQFLRTQRVSNCFIILAPNFWHVAQGDRAEAERRYGRFSSEGSIEDYLVENGLWGLRCVNRADFRIFHCQEWSLRLLDVRRAFQAGRKIQPFLRGYQDDLMGANARFYLHPGPPLIKRLRIRLGAWRRKFAGQRSTP